MKTYLHGPMDYAKKLKLRFRVRDLDLPERRKRYTSSREEKDVATKGTWTYQKEEKDIPAVGRRRTWLQICARVAQQ